MIVHRFRARSNLSLVLAERLAFDEVAQALTLLQVDGHTGHHTNERADHRHLGKVCLFVNFMH